MTCWGAHSIHSFDTHQAQLIGTTALKPCSLAANSHRQTGQPQGARALFRHSQGIPASPQAGDVAYQRIVTLYASNDPRTEGRR